MRSDLSDEEAANMAGMTEEELREAIQEDATSMEELEALINTNE